jgi:hypothetical protein
MSKQICNHCNNEFINLTSLRSHQKKSKYCLKLQNKEFICNGCNKIFHISNDLHIHKNNCVDNLKQINKSYEEKIKQLEDENRDNENLKQNIKSLEKKIKDIEDENRKNNKLYEEKIKELEDENRDIIYFQSENDNLKQKIIDIEKDKKEQIKSLQEQVKSLQEQIISITKTAVAKPTTTNNTTINNRILNMSVLNFNNDNVKDIIDDKYNTDIIANGQKGIAKFATNYLLTDQDGNLNYICTDVSRKIFKFKNDLGELEKDVNAKKLTNILSQNGLIEKTSNLSQRFWTNEDGSIDQDKFLSIIEKTSEIKNIKEDNTIFKNELANMTSI